MKIDGFRVLVEAKSLIGSNATVMEQQVEALVYLHVVECLETIKGFSWEGLLKVWA